MSILLWIAAAFAASPAHADGDPVPAAPTGVTLEWARPFVLAQPDVYPWQAGAPALERGWIVQLRVDPALLVPRQVGQPVLYAGTTPIAIVNADKVGGCAVGYVRGPLDMRRTPLFVGSTELPERIDAAAGQRELDAAVAAGAVAQPTATVDAAQRAGGNEAKLADLRGVYAILAERVAACSPGETDRIHTLRMQGGVTDPAR